MKINTGIDMRHGFLLTLLALTVAAAACTPTVNLHGNMIEDHQFTTIQPQVDTRNDVLRKLGSPTSTAAFDENTWYYIGQTMEKKGILDDKVTQERIVVVRFTPEGVVSNITDQNGQRLDIPYVRRKTPTSGNEMTALQQFFGNLGRFNKPAGAAGEKD